MFLFWVLRRQEQISELDLEIKSAKIKSAKTGAKVSQKRHCMKNKEASLDLLSDTEPRTASVHPLTKEKMYVQVAPSADPGIIYIYIYIHGPQSGAGACRAAPPARARSNFKGNSKAPQHATTPDDRIRVSPCLESTCMRLLLTYTFSLIALSAASASPRRACTYIHTYIHI